MAENKATTKKYRVKEGHVFGAEDQFIPGDIVELTDAEARGFLDTVEPVDGKPAPVETEEEAAPAKKAKKSEATG